MWLRDKREVVVGLCDENCSTAQMWMEEREVAGWGGWFWGEELMGEVLVVAGWVLEVPV